MQTPPLGCTKDELDTPALCVDLEAMEANIASLATTCRQHGIQWRPHSKCHKSPAIARKLLEAGAIGMTCAKLGEAEVMAAGGATDLLIANLIVGTAKVNRLVELRRRADPLVCIDHIDQAEAISRAMAAADLRVRALIEVDIGMCRAGVLPGEPTLELARQLANLPGIELAGLMGYEGHLLRIEDLAEKAARIHEALDRLVQSSELLRQAALPCPIVSCGGTGSYVYSVQHPGVTEVQAGGAIFMDEFYRNVCQVPELQFALTVLTTVVSRPTAERAIIDAGRKTMNQELQLPRVVGHEGIRVDGLSAEHGALQLDESSVNLPIGQRLELVPGYSDLTTVLHDAFYGFREGRLEVVWPLEARGKLQ